MEGIEIDNSGKTIINAEILCILNGVDDSLTDVKLGHGYFIEIIDVENFMFKDKITNVSGEISSDYKWAKILSGRSDFNKLVVLKKSEQFKASVPVIQTGRSITISDDNPFTKVEKEEFKDIEFTRINEIISKFQLFKAGDISIKKVFISFKWRYLFMNNNDTATIEIMDANTLAQDIYMLSEEEKLKCSDFQNNFKESYKALSKVIDNYTYSYKFISEAKGIEQLITTLEMMFLDKNQQAKKEVLAKRVALYIEKNDTLNIYNDIRDLYKYRSETTHEGKSDHVTRDDLMRLRKYSRTAIVQMMNDYENEYIINNQIDFDKFKSQLVTQLISEVSRLISTNILPS